MTLEEARRITETFETPRAAPTPATTTDIPEMLQRYRQTPESKAWFAKFKADADRAVPAGLTGEALIQFLYQRGTAAYYLGRWRRVLDDMAEARRRIAGDSHPLLGVIMWRLAQARNRTGTNQEGWSIFKTALDHMPNKLRRVFFTGFQAMSRARHGAFDHAEFFLDEAKELLEEARNGPDWPIRGGITSYILAWTTAVLQRESGRFTIAERSYRSALRQAVKLRSSHPGQADHRVRMRSQLAAVLARRDRFAEAEMEYRRALKDALLNFGRNSRFTAIALGGLAASQMDQGRFAEAERLLRIVVDILRDIEQPRTSRIFVNANLGLASLLVFRGRSAEAEELFSRIEKDIQYKGNFNTRQPFLSNAERSLALLRLGRKSDADAHSMNTMMVRARHVGEKRYDAAESEGIRAIVQVARGKKIMALALFRLAVPILSSPAVGIGMRTDGQAQRAFRLSRILESYVGFLADLRGSELAKEKRIDAVEEAFRIAQIAGSRLVQAALTSSLARVIARDSGTADLLRREQDARNQLNALSRSLVRALRRSYGDPEARKVVSLKARMDRLAEARAVLSGEIRRRHPDYFKLRDPKPASVSDVRAALRPGEALLATFAARDRTFVWAIPKTGPIRLHVSDLGREEITRIVDRLRGALDPDVATIGEIPDFDVAASHRLYAELLEPVRAAWHGAETLFVVANDPLDRLPFSVLVTGPGTTGAVTPGALFSRYRSVPWLAREVAVATLPAAASLVLLRRTPRSSRPRRAFVGFGDPQFSLTRTASLTPTRISSSGDRPFAVRGAPLRRWAGPRFGRASPAGLSRLPRLPDTADEVIAIGRALKADPTRNLFLGPAATEARVKSMTLSNYRIIAFATHGLAAGDLAGLGEPALALTSPAVSGGHEDGLLTMGEIMRLRLDADWVVLSACNTATGQSGGAEAMSGLRRAFFFAGTRALLVSNWRVESASAKALATDLFTHYAADPTLGKAEALRRAMIGLIDGPGFTDGSGETAFNYAHPIFWAPFSVVGDGGIRR